MEKRITNKNYREFLDNGIMTILTEEDINKALSNVKGKYTDEYKSFIITMYYTGARPNEILRLKAKSLEKKSNYIVVTVPASKRGLPRPIYVPYKHKLVKELYKYASKLFPDMYLFFHLRGNYTRTVINKKGEVKEYEEISSKVRYFFKQWFDNVIEGGIPPYYLRHNRFSKLMEAGATAEEVRLLKGAKSYNSVTAYLHMSTKSAKNIGRKIK